MFLNSLLTFFRGFKRNSSYMLINLIGLSLGIVVSCLILLFVFGEMSHDKFNTNYDNIYRLEKDDWALAGAKTGQAVGSHVSGIDNFVRLDMFGFSNSMVKWGDRKLRVTNFVLADTSFFSIFSIEFLKGNAQIAFDDPRGIVLTQSMAQSLFGSAPAMGETIRVKNQFDFVVSGIIKDPHNFHIPLQIIAPFESLRKVRSEKYMNLFENWNHPTYFQLNPNVDVSKVEEDINEFLSKISAFKGKNPGFDLRPLSELYFAKDIRYECLCKHGNLYYVYLFLGVGLIILGIAVINFVNLTTARAPLRAKEVGVRKVLGSSRNGLVWHFLGESFLLSIFAFSLALLGIYLLLPYFNVIMESELTYDFFMEPLFWVVFCFGILSVGLISGIYPAMVLSSYSTGEAFRRGSTKGGGGLLFRRLLIIFQFTVSVVLIIFTLTIYRQIMYFHNQDMGMSAHHVVSCPLNSEVVTQIQVFKDRVEQLSQVECVATSDAIPGNIKHQRTWPISLDDGVQYTYSTVEPEYFKVMDLEFVEGRNFSRENAADKDGMAIILNQTAVKCFGLKPPYVNSYHLPGWENEIRVIGVVRDFHFNSLYQPIAPLMFAWTSYNNRYVSIRLTGKAMKQTLQDITEIWEDISPNYPFEGQFLDQSFLSLYKKEERFAKLFAGFSFLAILIASLGLFGLAAFTTQQRKKEIGVRKVLGASDGVIVRLLVSEFGRWVLLSGIIAMPIAYWGVSQWLNNFPFHIVQTPLVYGAGVLICLLVALMTVSYHTYKAANLNPVDVIEYE